MHSFECLNGALSFRFPICGTWLADWNLPTNTVYWGKRTLQRFAYDPDQRQQTEEAILAVVYAFLRRRQSVIGQPLTKLLGHPQQNTFSDTAYRGCHLEAP